MASTNTDVKFNGGFEFDDGSKYVGGWNVRGQRHGLGHMVFENGSRYDGHFEHGLFHGLGVLKFPDGARYEGEFLEGWFHGRGAFWRSDGMRYEGEFRGGKIWGKGLVTFNDETHGFPRNEGYFQDCKLMKRQNCPEDIHRARAIALVARNQAKEQ